MSADNFRGSAVFSIKSQLDAGSDGDLTQQ
jgi:hypothetical protein